MNAQKKFVIPAVIILVLTVLFILFPETKIERERGGYSKIVLSREGEILRIFLNNEEQWIMPPGKEKIPETLKKCVIEFEDKNFYKHYGVDLLAIARALKSNITGGKIVSGASTITMQVSRIMTPKPRNIISKAVEIVQAVKLEIRYSKEEILKGYLDHAPYGGNTYGYRTASMRYFLKTPENLTWAEAAVLAVLPNSPGMITPEKRNNLLKAKRDKLLMKLYKNKIIDEETFKLALLETIPVKNFPFPFMAQHATNELNKNYDKDIIESSISRPLQIKLEKYMKEKRRELQNIGIDNAAVVIADTESGEVWAYAGSQDYYDNEHFGKVNGVKGIRSPGSTLKPLLFAKALDEGLITDESMLFDIPMYFGVFSPENYSGKFMGEIKAKDALSNSLNVPFVTMLKDYDGRRFLTNIKDMGISTIREDYDRYGLGLIIGGAEVTLWDMMKLYRGLGNYGDFSGITLIKGEKLKSNRVISRGSAYITLKALEEMTRPHEELYWNQYGRRIPVAWKTGTSNGFKDAWTLGVNRKWTIGVWTGNFTGRPNSILLGSRIAAPVMFDILNMLYEHGVDYEFTYPNGALKEVEVCADTGYGVSEQCPKTKKIAVSSEAQPLAKCIYHKSIFIQKEKSGYVEVCSLCWDREKVIKKEMLVYPLNVETYLKRKGGAVFEKYTHKKSCPGLREGKITITYPVNNSKIIAAKDRKGEIQRLKYRIDKEAGAKAYWYYDGRLVYEGTDEYIEVYPETGKRQLTVVDEDGERSIREFEIIVR